ncbi:MAG: HEAT repeat domain-containing protein, partial [Polyangiaceae bacterium]
AWPDALRRGLQGEVDAADDVAALLDDANVKIRRKAAEVTFRLAAPDVAAQVKRALSRDEDDEVKRWAALSLVRMGEPATPVAERLVHDADARWRHAAALAFALRGDARGEGELAAWWRDEGPSVEPRAARLDTADAKELLRALAKVHDADAVPALVDSLDYVPLRPAIADTLGQIGDARAKGPLLALFSTERYETARAPEARALLALGERRSLLAPLALFAGLADPMNDAVAIAKDAGLLAAENGGATFEPPTANVDVRVSVPPHAEQLRLWALAASEGGELSGELGGGALGSVTTVGMLHRADGSPPSEEMRVVRVKLHEPKGIRAVWVVPVALVTPPFLVPHAPDAG